MIMDHDQRQRHEESYIFRGLVRAAELEFASWEPSTPEIEARLPDGSTAHFELVRLDSTALLSQMRNQDTDWKAWDAAIKGLSSDEYHHIKGAHIVVTLVGNPGSRNRTEIYRKLLNSLLAKRAGFEGILVPYEPKAVPVQAAHVIQTGTDEPSYLTITSDRPRTVAWDRIKQKLSGDRYRVTSPLELVAYSIYDSILKTTEDRVPIEDINGWMVGSRFSRVWVYDGFMGDVVAVIPEAIRA
jgi:hypothetical protein